MLIRSIGEQLKQNQGQNANLTEVDLNKWMSQLKDLKKEFDQPSMIEIRNHEDAGSSTYLSFIHLRIIQKERGKMKDVNENRACSYVHPHLNRSFGIVSLDR